MLVIVATAKSALDELSDVSLRLLGERENARRRGHFCAISSSTIAASVLPLTFGIHLSIASIAILITSIAFQIHAGIFWDRLRRNARDGDPLPAGDPAAAYSERSGETLVLLVTRCGYLSGARVDCASALSLSERA